MVTPKLARTVSITESCELCFRDECETQKTRNESILLTAQHCAEHSNLLNGSTNLVDHARTRCNTDRKGQILHDVSSFVQVPVCGPNEKGTIVLSGCDCVLQIQAW